MKDVLVSVITTTFNADRYIRDTISSVLSQTYKNWELIISDDNSSDDTLKVVRSFPDKRIRILNKKQRLGLAENRNFAIKHAKGQLVAILDHDDLADSRRLEMQVAAFDNNPNLVLCGTYAYVIDENSVIKSKWEFPTSSNAIKAQFYLQFPIVHSSAMFKKDVFIKNKIKYQKKYSPPDDYMACFDLINHGEVEVIPEYLTLYRIHSKGINSVDRLKAVQKTLPKVLVGQYKKIRINLTKKDSEILSLFLNNKIDSFYSLLVVSRIVARLWHKLVKKYELSLKEKLYWWIYLSKHFLLNIYFLLDFTKS